jgi:hypothetical protein
MTKTLDRPTSTDVISTEDLEKMLAGGDIPCECAGDKHGPDGCKSPAEFRVSFTCEDPTCPNEHWLEMLCKKCFKDAVRTYGPELVSARPL